MLIKESSDGGGEERTPALGVFRSPELVIFQILLLLSLGNWHLRDDGHWTLAILQISTSYPISPLKYILCGPLPVFCDFL